MDATTLTSSTWSFIDLIECFFDALTRLRALPSNATCNVWPKIFAVTLSTALDGGVLGSRLGHGLYPLFLLYCHSDPVKS
jgi:hypothetical protein